ncbi:MAG TPA: isoprenylcysteine carboxylmethyltransferase family protein, partial [Steroidobacteraceae bacterium]|nr:isoprenylcysteine carboxylmethyltransferase family protein [Steroidobacteraceae bacterium]
MRLAYRYLIPALWLLWLAYWRISAADVKPTQRHESLGSRAAHLVPLLIAAVLLWLRDDPDGGWLFGRFLLRTEATFWIGALLTAAGLGFSAWARVHLGKNWSATVTVKEGHELIHTGPYARLRHPIYTGVLLGFLGTGIAIGEWRAVLALALVIIAFARKLRLEERWM